MTEHDTGNGTIVELVAHNNDIAEIVLNAPDSRNALSQAMLLELQQTLSSIDDKTRAVVLSAAGPVFCAGGDLSELGTGEQSDLAIDASIGNVSNRIRELGVPVIAAVEGACVGAGVDLLLACDLRVAAENVFVQVPAVRYGLLYNPAAVRRMRSRLGSTALNRLLLLGERLDANAARELGVLSHLAPTGFARERAFELASALSQAVPAAVSATKRYLIALEDGAGEPQEWEAERRKLLRSTERREAIESMRRSLQNKKT